MIESTKVVETSVTPADTEHLADSGQWVVQWTSVDEQALMWMGVGNDAEAAIADAQRECSEQGVLEGTLTAYPVVGD